MNIIHFSQLIILTGGVVVLGYYIATLFIGNETVVVTEDEQILVDKKSRILGGGSIERNIPAGTVITKNELLGGKLNKAIASALFLVIIAIIMIITEIRKENQYGS